MKKYIFTFLITLGGLTMAVAQSEISGYLDAIATDGINGVPATMNFKKAVEACRNLVHNGQVDWYLPSWEEVTLFVTATNAESPPECTGNNCAWNSTPTNDWMWIRTPARDNVATSMSIFHFNNVSANNTGYTWTNWTTARYVRCVR